MKRLVVKLLLWVLRNDMEAPDLLKYYFKVPNDIEGRMFINLCRKYKNTGNYRIRLRGRHPKRKLVMALNNLKQNFTRDIPIKYAAEIAVYIDPLDRERYHTLGLTAKRMEEYLELRRLLWDLKKRLK